MNERRSGWQGKITSLKSLELCYSSVRDVHIGKLTFLPALEELNLDSCPIGDWAIGHLADNVVVPNLTSLDLADTDLTDIGMAHIAKFNKLIRLSLFYCNISNRGLRHVAQLTALEVLNLDSREISDDGLSHLANLRNLKSLDIFSGRITDAGCGHIAKITSLESLELCGGGVGDAGCTRLAMLEKLTSLNLSQNERISNRGAAALAALTNLKALNLSNTRVNSSALCFFGGLLKLQSLALYGCHGIEDGARLSDLQNGLPNLKCLRLNSSSQEEGMVISHAADESDYSDEDRWEETNANGFERDMEDGDGDEDDDAFLSDYD
jgi:Leucine-rich repeat (LRR) protein